MIIKIHNSIKTKNKMKFLKNNKIEMNKIQNKIKFYLNTKTIHKYKEKNKFKQKKRFKNF